MRMVRLLLKNNEAACDSGRAFTRGALTKSEESDSSVTPKYHPAGLLETTVQIGPVTRKDEWPVFWFRAEEFALAGLQHRCQSIATEICA
jgi:hypothetical protein